MTIEVGLLSLVGMKDLPEAGWKAGGKTEAEGGRLSRNQWVGGSSPVVLQICLPPTGL